MYRLPSHASVEALLQSSRPEKPVYCIYPQVYRHIAIDFATGFPGRVLYAVKACSEPTVIKCMFDAGIRHFDCASLTEIETVKRVSANAACYFMVPVWLRGEIRAARERHSVRHFVVDHPQGIQRLQQETDLRDCVVFARMAIHHETALHNLSLRFGAPVQATAALLEAIAASGAEPALSFNVGTMVTSPEAYEHAISVAAAVLGELPFKLRLVDVGGGFPKSYPGFRMPRLNSYFEAIRNIGAQLPLAAGGELLSEPGRALAAPGMSALTEVLLRKDDRLYINDGMHGIFWELRYKGHEKFACRCYRNGRPWKGELHPFSVFGPTCDSADELPGKIMLPRDIQTGDHLEFGGLGAYSLSGRTDFNGRYSDDIVTIESADQYPPGYLEHHAESD